MLRGDAPSQTASLRASPLNGPVNGGAGADRVGLRFALVIDNVADPGVDVDVVIGVRIRNGTAEPYYRSFAIDVDWPWWVTAVTAGVSKIVEEFVDGKVERRLKPQILASIKQQIDALVDRLPGNLRLHQIRLQPDRITVTACPAGSEAPFLVVATLDPAANLHT